MNNERMDYDSMNKDRREFDRRDYDRREFDRREFDRREFDRRDYDRRDYDKNDYDRRDYDRRNRERREIYQRDNFRKDDRQDTFSRNGSGWEGRRDSGRFSSQMSDVTAGREIQDANLTQKPASTGSNANSPVVNTILQQEKNEQDEKH